jgi:hypothetical protein
VVEDHRVACGFVHQLQAAYEPLKAQHDTLRAQHAALVPVLDTALAWEAAYDAYGNVDGPFNMDRAEEALYQAVRAYRAAKGGT